MSERQGVEIDYCPTCRGVWLDRGELDKILDRAAGDVTPVDARPVAAPESQRHEERHGDDGGRRRDEPYRDEPSRGDQYRGDEHRGDRGDQYRGDQYRGDQGRGDQYRGDSRPPVRKKKESWLSDILDFG